MLHFSPAEPLLNRLSLCDPVADSQALVYGVGTIKLMASNAELRGQLNCAGVFSLLSSLIHTYVNKQVRHSIPLRALVYALSR